MWYLSETATARTYPQYRAFWLVVRSSFVFARSNCYWLKYIMWSILPNHSCCLRKQMKIELQVERLYASNLYDIQLQHFSMTTGIMRAQLAMWFILCWPSRFVSVQMCWIFMLHSLAVLHSFNLGIACLLSEILYV